MSVTLASTWRPRGEMVRFQKLYLQLAEVYESMVIVVPQTIDPVDLDRVKTLAEPAKVMVVFSSEPPWSRYLALRASLETSTGYIHYTDMDRLLRWVELRPLEWQKTVEAIPQADCLIIGRSEAAFQTHPQALQQTEKIINAVFSHLFDRPVDLGGGSRGLSRRSVQLLMAKTTPGNWTDAEWPMVLHRAGFSLDYLAVDGLDWESADRHRQQAADVETQRRLADIYDSDAAHWAVRAKMALDIIQAGLTPLNS